MLEWKLRNNYPENCEELYHLKHMREEQIQQDPLEGGVKKTQGKG